MRICLYTETALPRIGGQEMVIDALAQRFQAAGQDVRVLAPRPRGLPFDDRRHSYKVIRHPPFYSTRRFLGWYARGLAKFHRRWPFDVLHCHSVYPTAYLAALVKERIGVPLVVTSHGGDVREGNSRMRKPGVRARHSAGIAAADALIAISRYTREGYERLSPGAGPIISLPNGVDLEAFTTPAPRPNIMPPRIQPGEYFLCLGRMHPQKGGDALISAFARATRDSDSNARLVFAGGGPMRNEWEGLARRVGIADRCHFLGFVTGETKVHLLQNALATVIPTRQWEAFGLAVIESYAAGRPVIASQLPGLADLVRPDETGLVAPPGDVDALAGCLARIIEDGDLVERMGQTARQEARQYDWSRIADEHLKLYDRLLAGHQAAAA